MTRRSQIFVFPESIRSMSLIKSKKRVAHHGEVFTPVWMVEAMLDLVKGETERIDSRFLESACGSGNFRDEANVSQLVCLANLETLNSHFIHQGLVQSERLKLLNQTAIQQMKLLSADAGVRRLEGKKP